jgi:hypothetical protein
MAADTAAAHPLERFRVPGPRGSVFYVPDFVDDAAAAALLAHIHAAPKPKWTVLSQRRLQNWSVGSPRQAPPSLLNLAGPAPAAGAASC